MKYGYARVSTDGQSVAAQLRRRAQFPACLLHRFPLRQQHVRLPQLPYHFLRSVIMSFTHTQNRIDYRGAGQLFFPAAPRQMRFHIFCMGDTRRKKWCSSLKRGI